MLALVTVFLATALISLIAIWIYRKMFAWNDGSSVVVAKRGKTAKMKLKPQHGFVSIFKSTRAKRPLRQPLRRKVKSARLRNTTGTIKAPWGW